MLWFAHVNIAKGKYMRAIGKPHSVAILLFDNVLSLDVAGATDVFHGGNRYYRFLNRQRTDTEQVDFYQLTFVSASGPIVTAQTGLKYACDLSFRDVAPDQFDVLLVPGGFGILEAAKNTELVSWVQQVHKHTQRTISVCSGAVLLAKAGILDGKTACSHWTICALLAKQYPNVNINPDALYIEDGAVITSAGVTSGIDMALALIETDLGRIPALETARHLVVPMKRAGNQSQFSGPFKAQYEHKGSKMDAVISWILDHIKSPLPVEVLAEKAAMSPRSFARHFTNEVGETPAKFIEHARLETARALLDENQKLSLKETADACGFRSTEHLTRAFERKFKVHPNTYRESFGLT